MHRLDTVKDMLACAGVTRQGWLSLSRRKQVSLAFGLDQASNWNVLFDLDAAFIRTTLDLAPGLELATAAQLMRLNSDVLLSAIGQADATSEPVWLCVAQGEDSRGKNYLVAAGPLSQFAEFKVEGRTNIPQRMYLLNISDVLARIRANARKAGIDLSAAFFPPPGDELFEQIIREGVNNRRLLLAKLRGEIREAATA
jgi:hypothetical protein